MGSFRSLSTRLTVQFALLFAAAMLRSLGGPFDVHRRLGVA